MTHTLYGMLRKLEDRRIWYRIERFRPDSVTLMVTFVGERIEIDVFEDGHIEYSRFKGDESVEDDMLELDSIVANENRTE